MDSIQETVVVAVRVRPLDDNESKENAYNVVQQLPDEEKVLFVAGKGFAFDHIFTEESGQAAVYEEAVKPAVEKLFTGFNCAVIAYGHTGTGKTYTIGTDPKKCEEKCAGIISRAVEEVISGQDCDHFVEISFMEIYNEEVYDLLTSQPRKLHIQAFSVQSLLRVKVTTVEEAIRYLENGSSNRHTRATKLNAQSSRSHAIFSIYYWQVKAGEQSLISKLDLVDLAGSEGVRHTDSKGKALVEGNKINHGLLNLRNVISILSTNSKDYVPYRTSTLTSVLKDSLSRESYITMIACVSPSNLDVAHTIMTLRFAEEAKKVISKPKMNEIMQKFKTANPQAYESYAHIAPLIPSTPINRNLYKINHTPLVGSFRRPMMQLNNLSATSSSSVDLQDSVLKPQVNTIVETPSNTSLFSVSEASTSSKLDISEVASVLSPLFRKHMKQLQDQLQEKLDSVLLMSQQRPQASGNRDQYYTGSPVLEDNSNIRKILSVTECNERNLRNEMKNLRAEFQSLVEEKFQKFHQSDVSLGEETGSVVAFKKLRHSLLYSDDSPHKENYNASSSNGASILTSEKRMTRRSTPVNQMDSSDSISQKTVLRRKSIRISKQRCYRICAYSSTPEDRGHDSRSFTNISTIKKRPRMSGRRENEEDSTFISSPTKATAVRRSLRLSVRNATKDTGNLSLMNLSMMTTVRRNQRTKRISKDEANVSITCTHSQKTGEDSLFNPSRTSTVKRSERLSRKPRRCYRVSPVQHPQKKRNMSWKPVLAVSPSDMSSEGARDKLKKKVLQMLNGSLRELTQLVTVGPKTALIIYNYRLLNNCKFEKLEDLTNIPGLASSYYKRFMMVLLVGPPGCGKTSLVRRLAADCGAVLISVLGSEVFKPRPGDTESWLRQVFEEAVALAEEGAITGGLCVLLVDEVDSICPKRGGRGTSSHQARVSTQLLKLLEDADDVRGLVVIATSNRPSALDPAIRRPGRLENEVHIGVPTEIERQQIVEVLMSPLLGDNMTHLYHEVARLTPGYVGADLCLLYQHVALDRLRNKTQSTKFSMEDFHAAVTRLRPSSLRGGLGVVTTHKIELSDIGGLGSIKQSLRTAIEWPLLYPEVFARFALPHTKGVLLYGPPGCAKTSLVRGLVSAMNVTFLSISAAELYSPYVGDAEKSIGELFHRARLGAPTILFIDEIDALVGSRGCQRERGVQERVLSALLTEMDGIGVHLDSLSSKSANSSQLNTGVVVVAATNRPDILDDALLRPGRFDKLLYVPPPDAVARLDILRVVTARMPLSNCVDLEAVACHTEFFSGADLSNLCREAALHVLTEEGMTAKQIKQKHFIHVLGQIRASLSEQQIQWYKSYKK